MRKNKKLQNFVNWAFEQDPKKTVDTTHWYTEYGGCFLGEYLKKNKRLGLKLVKLHRPWFGATHTIRYKNYSNGKAVVEYFGISLNEVEKLVFVREKCMKSFKDLQNQIKELNFEGVNIPT